MRYVPIRAFRTCYVASASRHKLQRAPGSLPRAGQHAQACTPLLWRDSSDGLYYSTSTVIAWFPVAPEGHSDIEGWRLKGKKFASPACSFGFLEFRHFSEVEVVDFHGRHHHLERLFASRADGRTQQLGLRQHLQDALVEPHVADAGNNLAALNEKRAVARHPSEDFFVGVHFPDVPEARRQDAVLGRGDHLFQR